MHDAVVLANCIYEMKDSSPTSIATAFEEYYEQRYYRLESHFKRSKTWMLTGQVMAPIRFSEWHCEAAPC